MENRNRNNSENPRRKFIKNAGGLAVTLVGVSGLTMCSSPIESKEKSLPKDESKTVFLNKPATIEDRIQRVKLATLGMQRYDWEQGAVAQAFLEMGETDLVVSLARGAIMRQENGRFSILKGNGPITDCSSVGEAVLFAGKITGDPIFKKGVDEMLDVIKKTSHKNSEGIIYHTQEPVKNIMSDVFYMLPPFLAAVGEYNEAIKQIDGNRKILYHSKEQLYSHIWDDTNKKFAREDFWGIGNGWTASGLTRVIKMLPDNMMEGKKKLIGYVKEIIDGCLKFMDVDGLFHNVLNKQETFREVNLSQMLAYSIFRGVKAGYLDSLYLQKARIMRKAANERVDNLGYVQEVCGCPNFDRLYVAPEAQAFYLLMEAAAKDLGEKL